MTLKKTRFFFLFLLVFFLHYNAFSQVIFQSGQSLSTGIRPEVVCTGDINNDGKVDIVAATGSNFGSPFQYLISVFKQSNAGTFPTTETYPYSASYPGLKAMDLKDVNNDSLNDVVIGFGDSIAIFFQNNLGKLDTMIKYYCGTGVDDIKAGDLNNDGLNDIVVSLWNDSYIRVFYQNSTGFSNKIYTKPLAGYDEIEIGDLNSDGLNDVVFMAGQGYGGIHVFTQNSGGTLNNYVSYFPGGGGSWQMLNGIAIADVNNDGAKDLLATMGGNQPNAYLTIWYQDTATKLLKTALITPAYEIPTGIDVADFNCDGKPEIFMNHNGFSIISVWSPSSGGKYTSYEKYAVSVAQHPKPECITAADINSDGKLDIVSLGDNNAIQLLYNKSIPSTFSNIDTIITIDTIAGNPNGYFYFTSKAYMDSTKNIKIIYTDSFKINYLNRMDSAHVDSSFFRTGNLCTSVYTDKIIHNSYSFFQVETRDTVFWSRNTDTIRATGLYEYPEVKVNLYPNPFNSEVTILANTNETKCVSFFNLAGIEILQQNFTNSMVLSTDHFMAGLYFYRIKNSKGMIVKTGKIIKE